MVVVRFVCPIAACAEVSLAVGSPIFVQMASTVPPKQIPEMSEKIWLPRDAHSRVSRRVTSHALKIQDLNFHVLA